VSDQIFRFEVTGEGEQRLDKFLVICLPELSRSRLQGLIRDGFVFVDGVGAYKSGQVINAGQEVEVRLPPPQPSNLIPEELSLDVVFENSDALVINKPAGMVVHPAAGHSSGTLVHGVLGYDPAMEGVGGIQRPGLVHRLDKNTSGLIILAKNDHAHHWLQEQFRLRQVTKIYWALVDGHPPTPQGRIEAAVGRDPAHRQRMAIVPASKGREAVTEYRSLEYFHKHELIEARPITGRTHQIRLHMAFIHCPVVGDTLYGHRHPTLPMERFFLHAARLTIILPGEKEPHTFETPLPPELAAVLDGLRGER
jgi:23S rRNA pseudouridine1911/1915/1917 synthase